MYERKMIHTDRGAFEVFFSGKGDPLCITHLYSEFTEIGHYFANSFVNHFKVILVNLKGAGNSSVPEKDDELSMEETCKDLESIRKAFNFKKWGFAGHSTGGMLGLIYAINFPHSLTKLMVGGATASKAYMSHNESMYSTTCPLNPRLKEIFSLLNSSEATAEEKRRANMEWNNMSLYNVERREAYFSKPSSGRVVHRRLNYFSNHDLPTYDVREKLLNVKVPTYVFCGKHDAQCPLYFSEEITNLLPNSRLFIYDYSNHFPFIEERDEFKKMVSDFHGFSE